ncbi:MAG: hypothetical protein BIFFINMI_03153 [Phycisphaerae bacterium]|nr:hypothetical protein [Phycisphaerae bacterium]
MTVLGQIVLLTGKDLRIELRTRQTVGLVITLGLLIVTVLGLGLAPEGKLGGYAAPAVLWVAYLFGGVLIFEKTMDKERRDGAMAGLMMAPIDRGVIFLAKLLSNLALLGFLAVVIALFAIVLFGLDLSAAPGGFAGVMAMSLLGFAAVGTLFSALTSSTRLSGGLLAMLVFPIAIPLVIASTSVLNRLFASKPAAGDDGTFLTALGVLVAFDVVFLVVSWLIFEVVLEP